MIFLLIHKSLSHTKEMDQWFVPFKATSFFFISNYQLLPLYINFLMFLPILSLILLSCIFTLPCLCEQELRMRVKFVRKYTFEYPVSIYFVSGI